MTDCPDCQQARVRAWGGYRAKCIWCTARAIARSLAAWDALHIQGNGDRQPLTDLVARLLPNVATDQARRMVLAWWRHDNPKPQPGSAP